ncbi:ATP-binding protein [Telmatospirillum sp. J64-1]|uniref:ATP-binding protein n=1 Tax=Telmatospirillum sp. J64-1 TaxID=2502183 RepID=UPI00115ECF96|nr:ATP-binding protein [Telmatospirillum sp. J64-1]
MLESSSHHEPFGVLGADGCLLYCSPGFARLIGEGAAPAAGTAIGTSLVLDPDGKGEDISFLHGGPHEGSAWTRDGTRRLRYRLEPMAERESASSGAVLFLWEDDPASALDQIYHRAFHLNPGLSAISVIETGQHLDVNDAWLNALEYRREEVIGRTAAELNIWDKGESGRAEIVRRLRECGRVENMLARMRTKNGHARDIIVSAEVVEHRGRKLAFFASHDITELRRFQSELTRLNRDLEERVAARTADIVAKNAELAGAISRAEAANEAKSRFLSMMSHEIRTPLNAVINMVDLLLETERSQSDRSYLGAIATASKALLAIVNDILDVSRIEAGRVELAPVPTDIEEIMEEVVQSVAPLAHRKGLDIAATLGRNLPATAVVDPARLRQILLNLAGNAVKFTPSGWVHIEADRIRRNGGDVLVFEVVDTGIGIDAADHDQIFERFTQLGTVDVQSGTGLGLSISHGLAQAMGGTITVNSQPGQGSSFRLILPVSGCGGPKDSPPLPRVALLGPPTRTQRAVAATLVSLGAELRVIDRLEAPPPLSRTGEEVALIVLPVGPEGAAEAGEWCRLGCRLGLRMVLLAPVGQALPDVEAYAAQGITVATYPLGRASLIACLQARPSGVEREEGEASLAGIRILVVDDTEVNRLVAERGLAAVGAVVTAVDSGEAALDLLAKDSFDLVLMDLLMPGLDGYATAARIRTLGGASATVPILAVSATVTPEVMEKIRQAGMNGHLAKPFRPRDLRAAVQRILAETGPVVCDEDILGEYRDLIGPDALIDTATRFLQRLGDYRDAIREAGDAETRANACHRFAGAAGALGLAELVDFCRTEEARARAPGGFRRDDDLLPLAAAVQRAERALRDALSRLPS